MPLHTRICEALPIMPTTAIAVHLIDPFALSGSHNTVSKQILFHHQPRLC